MLTCKFITSFFVLNKCNHWATQPLSPIQGQMYLKHFYTERITRNNSCNFAWLEPNIKKTNLESGMFPVWLNQYRQHNTSRIWGWNVPQHQFHTGSTLQQPVSQAGRAHSKTVKQKSDTLNRQTQKDSSLTYVLNVDWH